MKLLRMAMILLIGGALGLLAVPFLPAPAQHWIAMQQNKVSSLGDGVWEAVHQSESARTTPSFSTPSATKPTLSKTTPIPAGVPTGLAVSDLVCGYGVVQARYTEPQYFWLGLRGKVTNSGNTIQSVTVVGVYLASDGAQIGSGRSVLGTMVPGKVRNFDIDTFGIDIADIASCDLKLGTFEYQWSNSGVSERFLPLRFQVNTKLPLAVQNKPKLTPR